MCAFINRAVLKNLFTLVCLWKSIRIKNKNIEDSTCVSCDTHYESAKTQAVMYSHFVWYSGKKESYKTSNTFTSWNYSITFVIASLPLIQWGSVMCNILTNVVDFIETDKRLKNLWPPISEFDKAQSNLCHSLSSMADHQISAFYFAFKSKTLCGCFC